MSKYCDVIYNFEQCIVKNSFASDMKVKFMTAAVEIDKITKIIENTLKADFDHLHVIEVKVAGDVDFDGDDVLRVQVVFEGEPESVDASRLAGVVRHVRPKLLDIKEHAFPIFSFISDSDYKDLRCVPA